MSRKELESEEKKRRIMHRHGYQCAQCHRPAKYLAHQIAKSKANLKKYGERIIHHELAMLPVCERPECNDRCNIGNNPGEVAKLLEVIREYDSNEIIIL